MIDAQLFVLFLDFLKFIRNMNFSVRKKLVIISVFLLFSIVSFSQVAWLVPQKPCVDDTVTLYFNPNSGNMGLAETTEDVYFHTGAITSKSLDGGDWKHVVGNWGEKDERTLMVPSKDGLYEKTFVIKDFYALSDDQTVNQLAFVFRNEDGSKVAKTAFNDDILIPLQGYVPPVIVERSFDFDKRKILDYLNRDSIIDIITDHGLTQIIVYNNNIIEVIHHKQSVAETDISDAVIMKSEMPLYSVYESDNWLNIKTDSLSLAIHKDPFFVSFIFEGDTILREERGLYKTNENDGLRFEISENEKLYGLGERANTFNLTGYRYELYNRPKYGYEYGARNINYSVPLVVSSKKYLMFFDNPQKGYADIGETEKGILEWGAIGGTMNYFIVAGSTFKSISSQYAKLTGSQPLPPIWALGNLQSRMGYRSQFELDSIVDLTLREDFPLDAKIIDLYWFGDSLQGTMGRLDWYKPNWPEPKKMISDLRKKGVKTVLITEPYILDSLSNFKIADSLGILAVDSNGESYINREFYFGDGALIDIFKPTAGDWFWEQYQKQIEIGVAGWWGDLGEPESHPSDQLHVNGTADEVHNIYGHYWHKMLFDNYRKHYPDARLFNLNRAGYAGSQRYSIYPWTGDVSRSWGGLKAQIPLMLHMGLSGLPMIHSDAGGFAQGAVDNELYTRWLQMSCFSPILRPHGSGIPSEPVYFNDTTKHVVRNFMKSRYKLLPYIYTLAAEAKIHGYPIVRPLFYEFPLDSTTYNIEFEYMFGDDILVAPVVEEGIIDMNVYLPKGVRWYNYFTDIQYDGGKWDNMKLDIETIPIFIKSGSFIPTIPYHPNTDDYNTSELTFTYYFDHSGKNNVYTLFSDDGVTYGTIEDNAYQLITIKREKVSDNKNVYTISKYHNDYLGEPLVKDITLEIVGLNKSDIKKLLLNGDDLTFGKNTSGNSYYFDKENNRWIVKFVFDGEEINITQYGMIH